MAHLHPPIAWPLVRRSAARPVFRGTVLTTRNKNPHASWKIETTFDAFILLPLCPPWPVFYSMKSVINTKYMCAAPQVSRRDAIRFGNRNSGHVLAWRIPRKAESTISLHRPGPCSGMWCTRDGGSTRSSRKRIRKLHSRAGELWRSVILCTERFGFNRILHFLRKIYLRSVPNSEFRLMISGEFKDILIFTIRREMFEKKLDVQYLIVF